MTPKALWISYINDFTMKNEVCTTILLAGGESKRMGKDKALLNYKGEALLTIQIIRWMNVFDHFVLSVAKGNKDKYNLNDNITVIEDDYLSCGPLGALCTIMEKTFSDIYFMCALDLPFSSENLAKWMKTHFQGKDILIIQRANGIYEPLFAFYARSCLPIIKKVLATNQRSIVKGLLPETKVEVLKESEIPFDLNTILFNTNNPQDWEKALAISSNPSRNKDIIP